MIRWYDYIIAIGFADVLLVMAFSIPYVGFVVAYAAYEYLWDAYCKFRLEQEYDKWR